MDTPVPVEQCSRCMAILKRGEYDARGRERFYVSQVSYTAHPSHITAGTAPYFVTGLLCPVTAPKAGV